MNLKLKISPLILILAFISSFPAQSQSSIEVVKSYLTEKLKKKLVDKSPQLELYYKDN